jgi:hypothetical protein
MAGIGNILFDDKNVRPTDEMIFSHIGDKKDLWIDLMDHISSAYKDSEGQWNYYNDGKRWLYKQVYKKKTLFWISVSEGTFSATFYFGDKAEPSILAGNLSEKIRDEFINGKRYGKIRGISIQISGPDDMVQIRELIAIKSRIR